MMAPDNVRDGFATFRSRFVRGARGSVAAVSLAVFLPARLLAQAAPGSIELGGGLGGFVGGTFARGSTELGDVELQADDQTLKGFWVGAQLSRDWAFEIAVRRIKTTFIIPAGGVFASRPEVAGLDLGSVEAFGFRSFRFGNFLPYVGAGLGFTNLDPNTPDPAIRDSNRFCVSIGIGGRFYVTRWLGARVDVRGRAAYLGERGFGRDGGWTDTGRWFSNGELLGGAFVSLGGSR